MQKVEQKRKVRRATKVTRPLPSETGGEVGYGIDQPGLIKWLLVAAGVSGGIGTVSFFFIVTIMPSVGRLLVVSMLPAAVAMLALGTILCLTTIVWKPKLVKQMVGDLPWGGSEVVVDVGCGRGMMTVDAAEWLTDGIAVGVDQWHKSDLSGNAPSSLWANARAEKALDKVAAIKADPRHLPFASGSVDVAMSSMGIGRLSRKADRREAVSEMLRITKNGGRLAIVDAGNGSEYGGILGGMGAANVHVARPASIYYPTLHSVQARKPFTGLVGVVRR